MTVNEELFEAVANNDIDKVKLLVKEVANLDLFNKLGITPLLLACRNGFTDIVKILVEAEADVDKKANLDIFINEGLTTALISACYYGHKEIVEILINAKANVNATNICGSTALWHAITKHHVEIVKMLIAADKNIVNVDNVYHDSALSDALLSTYLVPDPLEISKILIDSNVDVNQVNIEGNSPLMVASTTMRYDESNLKSTDTIEMLLAANAQPNITNNEGNSALILSLQKGHKDHLNIAKILINAGVDLNVVNIKGESALTWAILGSHKSNPSNHDESTKFYHLIDNKDESASLSLYNEYIEVIKLLLSHRCNITLSEKLLAIVNSDDLLKELITSNQAATLLSDDKTESVINSEVNNFESEDSFVEATGATDELN